MSIFKHKRHYFLTLLFAFSLLLSSNIRAADAHGEEEEEASSSTSFIMHHIKDAYDWHFATIGHTHITLPLPVIIYSPDRGLEFYMSSDFKDHETHEPVWHNGYKIDEHEHLVAEDASREFYDLSITKNVAMLFITVIVLGLIALRAAKHYKKDPKRPPKGIASFIEPVIIYVRDEIAKPNIGPKYHQYLPYLLSLFFFIWIGNLLGLVPGAANLTGNIAVTFTLAVLTFIITNVSGNRAYWKHIFATPGVPWPILPIMIPVEFIGLFTKPFALMVRLFVAITAGHIVILSLIGLAFIFNSYTVGIVSTLIVLFINIIELLVATIQAYVFTLFTAMYIGLATADHHEEH